MKVMIFEDIKNICKNKYYSQAFDKIMCRGKRRERTCYSKREKRHLPVDKIVCCEGICPVYNGNKERIWIAGQWSFDKPWLVIGIFDTEQKAVNACYDKYSFVMPYRINERHPLEFVVNPECYYPLNKNDKKCVLK
jgi:hypothetical protein